MYIAFTFKKYMFSMLKTMAENDGCDTIIEGSNYDDRKDFRPGHC